MLESYRKKKIYDPNKKTDELFIEGLRINDVNVQIGMYKTLVAAEKDMPNILLLNIDLLTDIDNGSIKIKKNNEKKYSIFVNEITYVLAENLCVRIRSQETSCNILPN